MISTLPVLHNFAGRPAVSTRFQPGALRIPGKPELDGPAGGSPAGLEHRARLGDLPRKAAEATPGGLHSWLLSLLIACLVFPLFSCAGRTPGLQPAGQPAAPIVERLQERCNRLSGFRALGTLRLEGGTKHWSGRAFLLVGRPQSLRLEMLGPLGQPLLYVASDGARFSTWVPGQPRAYQGVAPDNVLATLVDFPLDDREALLLLAGLVPNPGYPQVRLFRDSKSGNLLLAMEGGPGDRTQRVWLEPDGSTVIRIERLRGYRRELEAWFTDFATDGGFRHPEGIRIEASGFHLAIHYEQFVINGALDENAFRLQLPSGVEVLPW
jgi:hypothetical protein